MWFFLFREYLYLRGEVFSILIFLIILSYFIFFISPLFIFLLWQNPITYSSEENKWTQKESGNTNVLYVRTGFPN